MDDAGLRARLGHACIRIRLHRELSAERRCVKPHCLAGVAVEIQIGIERFHWPGPPHRIRAEAELRDKNDTNLNASSLGGYGPASPPPSRYELATCQPMPTL